MQELLAELTAVLVRYRETGDPSAFRRYRELRTEVAGWARGAHARRILARAAERAGWDETSVHSRYLGSRREPPPARAPERND